MPTPAENVSLLIGGKAHDKWESYDIDSDLQTPADAWQVSFGLPVGALPDAVVEGAAVEVRVGSDTVMVGRIDEITEEISHGSHTLGLSGRDGAAILLDCSAPIFTAQQVSLADIVAKIVRPLGITKIKIDADSTLIRNKVNVEPGDTAWDALTHAAEANGLWPWFAPDGTLVVGGPDYTNAPVATLIMRRSGKGNNVKSLARQRSVQDRYSVVTVLGQAHGTSTETGKNNLRGSYTDTGMTWNRPKIVTDSEADSVAVCQDRARKLISDGRLKGYTLTAKVKGHRIVAPGHPGDGLLWTPGQRIYVVSEPHGIDAIFFLMARKFTGSRQGGTETTLTLKEDKVWVLDAHPHKGKHRRGKNALSGQIVQPGDAG
ncbi:MAG: phage tail protein [Sulfuriferula sp.]|nr:phage tail protein [Sulfuriferula sp.]